MYKIFIEELSLDASIGIFDFEKERKQKIEISVVLEVSDFVDYRKIVDIIKEIVNSRHFNFLEELANSILAILKKEKRIKKARIKLIKPFIIKEAKVGVELSF